MTEDQISAWAEMRSLNGEPVQYLMVEVQVPELDERGYQKMMRIERGPLGFVLPSITHRPWTVLESLALSGLIAYAEIHYSDF